MFMHKAKTRSWKLLQLHPAHASRAGKFLLNSKAVIAGAQLFPFGQHIQANTWQQSWHQALQGCYGRVSSPSP